MSNHFIRITSNGGYIGRWCWCNTGAPGADGWGSGAWAGSIPIIRLLTR